jgi:beta-lactamase class D
VVCGKSIPEKMLAEILSHEEIFREKYQEVWEQYQDITQWKKISVKKVSKGIGRNIPTSLMRKNLPEKNI